jgi:CBS domain-containing protein
MHTGASALPPEASVDGAKQRFKEEKCTSWPVGNGDYIEGVISSHRIEASGSPPGTIHDLIKGDGRYPFVHADHPLSHALEQMRDNSVDVVPVVSRSNIHRMAGVVTLTDILSTYGVSPKTDGEHGR